MGRFDALVRDQAAAIAGARAQGAVQVKPLASAAELLGLPFAPGQRVLDQVTGATGTVVDGTIKNSVQPQAAAAGAGAAPALFTLPKPVLTTAILVQLDGGAQVERDPAQLVDLPPGLTVPLSTLEPV